MEVISGWRTFAFLSTLYCSGNFFSHGGDTLEQGLSIRDQKEARNPAQSLVSANGIFELGFFSPANSENRYVGIWYKKVKERTVVWIANRNEPLKDDTGSLMIAPNGNLMIRNAPGMTIILSTASSQSHMHLKLLDSGNLVLIEGNEGDGENRILWQSFDYPSDTCLPDMKLGAGKMGEGSRMLTSWRGKDDPSPGAFTLGLDSGSASQLYVLKERRNIQWMSGFWNGQVFNWIPETRVYNFRFESNENGSYFSYSASDAFAVSRLMLDVSGEVKLFAWSDKTEEWSLLWSQPRGVCDFSERCGPNTVCDSYASPPCKCLPGFEPLSPEDWRSNVWSAGCKRQTPLACGVGDSFMQMKMTRLPAPSYNLRESNVRLEDCNAMCIGRCSCMAYASADEDGTGCYLWNDNVLIGLQANNRSGQNIYVRLSVLEPGGKTKRRLWIMAPVIVPSVFVGASICYLRRRAIIKRRRSPRYKGKRETSEDEPFFNLAATPLGKNGLEFQVFDLATISAATDNFSLANKLGEGGFGPVYKGKLHKGKQIAVKRLSGRSNQGLEEFRNEVILIAKLQHINLVRLLGCCIEEEEKILVYEYMPNKSLDSFLFDPAKRKLLDWRTCIRIINGIAQGLLYLHKYSRLRIIHRDLKASNILLDSEMNPKISDFGMARIFGQDESEANTKRIVGTYGYMSPEYAMGGLFSEKSDVFSFGVLLLEIVTGKKNSSFNGFEKSVNLLGYAWDLWKEGRSLDLIDPALRDSSPEWEITRCIHLGLLCVQDSARDRPTMSSVAALLSNETIPLADPTRPAFPFGRDLIMTSQGTYSANHLTISVMEAR